MVLVSVEFFLIVGEGAAALVASSLKVEMTLPETQRAYARITMEMSIFL